jgi:hypothetical protein
MDNPISPFNYPVKSPNYVISATVHALTALPPQVLNASDSEPPGNIIWALKGLLVEYCLYCIPNQVHWTRPYPSAPATPLPRMQYRCFDRKNRNLKPAKLAIGVPWRFAQFAKHAGNNKFMTIAIQRSDNPNQ